MGDGDGDDPLEESTMVDGDDDPLDVLIDEYGFEVAEASEALMKCGGDLAQALSLLETVLDDSRPAEAEQQKPVKKSRRKKANKKEAHAASGEAAL